MAKAGAAEKLKKKIKRKKAPEGFVNWNQNTFDKLIDAEPETLVHALKITHSMVLNEVEQGGDARGRIDRLIDDSAQTSGSEGTPASAGRRDLPDPVRYGTSSRPNAAPTAAWTI